MSKVEVNQVTQQCGTTLTVGGGACKTAVVDATTVTLGRCGGTVSLASGATQSGFGRTGTVDWCTTAKTSPFTAATGKGYMVNTCGGVITVTLPGSPSAGDIVSVADYKSTFCSNAVTLGRNSSKINGACEDASLATQGQSVTLVYIDGTQGWKSVQDSTSDVTGESFISASGGNATVTCGNYKTHIFTGDGCFAVSSISNSVPNNTLDYLVIAGGGASGGDNGGGGGAGGLRVSNALSLPVAAPIASPTGLTATAATFPITVGGGGASAGTGTGNSGCSGDNSIFSTITSTGGGASGGNNPQAGLPGGSGGGGWHSSTAGGSGNTPPFSPPQGNDGGTAHPSYGGGGGGGAGACGCAGGPNQGGDGGIGSYIGDGFVGPTAPSYGEAGPVSNSRFFAGGGAGGNQPGPTGPYQGAPGIGGGGQAFDCGSFVQQAGGTNTGGGAGSGNPGTSPVSPAASTSGAGGSGIVMIRYKYQ